MGGGIGFQIIEKDGKEHYYMATLTFKITNNEAEHEALIVGLSIAKAIGIVVIEAKVDSQIMVKSPGHKPQKGKVEKKILEDIRDRLTYFSLEQILREDNSIANIMAKGALVRDEVNLSW